MYQKYISLILILLFFSCDFSPVTENYNPDYTPEISVFALISTDDSNEFVIVERTMQVNEYYEAALSQTSLTKTIIDNAEVYLISATDTVQFTFYRRKNTNIWDQDYLSKGMYLDQAHQFRAETGKTYQLLVKVPDGRTVTGTTTVPAIPEISQPLINESLNRKTIKTTSVQWQNNPNTIGYIVNFYIKLLQTQEWINILTDHFVYESPTTLDEIDDYYLLNEHLAISSLATVKVLALDQNSYDYVRKSGLASLVGTDLQLLDGGIGAFGSYSVDSVRVRLR